MTDDVDTTGQLHDDEASVDMRRLRAMISAGVLSIGDEVSFEVKSSRYVAKLGEDGSLRHRRPSSSSSSVEVYTSPTEWAYSMAHRHNIKRSARSRSRGKITVNGWDDCCVRGRPLKEFRTEMMRDAKVSPTLRDAAGSPSPVKPSSPAGDDDEWDGKAVSRDHSADGSESSERDDEKVDSAIMRGAHSAALSGPGASDNSSSGGGAQCDKKSTGKPENEARQNTVFEENNSNRQSQRTEETPKSPANRTTGSDESIQGLDFKGQPASRETLEDVDAPSVARRESVVSLMKPDANGEDTAKSHREEREHGDNKSSIVASRDRHSADLSQGSSADNEHRVEQREFQNRTSANSEELALKSMEEDGNDSKADKDSDGPALPANKREREFEPDDPDEDEQPVSKRARPQTMDIRTISASEGPSGDEASRRDRGEKSNSLSVDDEIQSRDNSEEKSKAPKRPRSASIRRLAVESLAKPEEYEAIADDPAAVEAAAVAAAAEKEEAVSRARRTTRLAAGKIKQVDYKAASAIPNSTKAVSSSGNEIDESDEDLGVHPRGTKRQRTSHRPSRTPDRDRAARPRMNMDETADASGSEGQWESSDARRASAFSKAIREQMRAKSNSDRRDRSMRNVDSDRENQGKEPGSGARTPRRGDKKRGGSTPSASDEQLEGASDKANDVPENESEVGGEVVRNDSKQRSPFKETGGRLNGGKSYDRKSKNSGTKRDASNMPGEPAVEDVSNRGCTAHSSRSDDAGCTAKSEAEDSVELGGMCDEDEEDPRDEDGWGVCELTAVAYAVRSTGSLDSSTVCQAAQKADSKWFTYSRSEEDIKEYLEHASTVLRELCPRSTASAENNIRINDMLSFLAAEVWRLHSGVYRPAGEVSKQIRRERRRRASLDKQKRRFKRELEESRTKLEAILEARRKLHLEAAYHQLRVGDCQRALEREIEKRKRTEEEITQVSEMEKEAARRTERVKVFATDLREEQWGEGRKELVASAAQSSKSGSGYRIGAARTRDSKTHRDTLTPRIEEKSLESKSNGDPKADVVVIDSATSAEFEDIADVSKPENGHHSGTSGRGESLSAAEAAREVRRLRSLIATYESEAELWQRSCENERSRVAMLMDAKNKVEYEMYVERANMPARAFGPGSSMAAAHLRMARENARRGDGSRGAGGAASRQGSAGGGKGSKSSAGGGSGGGGGGGGGGGSGGGGGASNRGAPAESDAKASRGSAGSLALATSGGGGSGRAVGGESSRQAQASRRKGQPLRSPHA